MRSKTIKRASGCINLIYTVDSITTQVVLRKLRCIARIGAKLGVWRWFRTLSHLGAVLDGAVNKRVPSIAKSKFDADFLGGQIADFERGAPVAHSGCQKFMLFF